MIRTLCRYILMRRRLRRYKWHETLYAEVMVGCIWQQSRSDVDSDTMSLTSMSHAVKQTYAILCGVRNVYVGRCCVIYVLVLKEMKKAHPSEHRQ
jgi:hypothetical protein